MIFKSWCSGFVGGGLRGLGCGDKRRGGEGWWQWMGLACLSRHNCSSCLLIIWHIRVLEILSEKNKGGFIAESMWKPTDLVIHCFTDKETEYEWVKVTQLVSGGLCGTSQTLYFPNFPCRHRDSLSLTYIYEQINLLYDELLHICAQQIFISDHRQITQPF